MKYLKYCYCKPGRCTTCTNCAKNCKPCSQKCKCKGECLNPHNNGGLCDKCRSNTDHADINTDICAESINVSDALQQTVVQSNVSHNKKQEQEMSQSQSESSSSSENDDFSDGEDNVYGSQGYDLLPSDITLVPVNSDEMLREIYESDEE